MALKLLLRGDKSICLNGMEWADFSDAKLTVLVYFGPPPPRLLIIYTLWSWVQINSWEDKCEKLTEKTLLLLYKPAMTQKFTQTVNFWSVLIICGCYIDCRLCFAIIPFKLFFIFSRLCITAFRLFFLIFNISDCVKGCYPVECSRAQVWFEGCVSWNNMMLISNRHSHRSFLISDNVSENMQCDDACHAIIQS